MALLARKEPRGLRPQSAIGAHHGEKCAEATEGWLSDQGMRPSRNVHAQAEAVLGTEARKRNQSLPDTGDGGRGGTADRRMAEVPTKLMNPSQTATRQIRIRVPGVVVVHVRVTPITIPVQGVTEHVMGIRIHTTATAIASHSTSHSQRRVQISFNALSGFFLYSKPLDRKSTFTVAPHDRGCYPP